MAYAGEEAALLGQGATVAHHGKGVHLKTVVVVEAQRLVLDDAFVQLETTLFKTLARAGMTAVKNGHVVLLCHLIDGGEEAHEVLFRVDVLLSVSREQNIILRFKV